MSNPNTLYIERPVIFTSGLTASDLTNPKLDSVYTQVYSLSDGWGSVTPGDGDSLWIGNSQTATLCGSFTTAAAPTLSANTITLGGVSKTEWDLTSIQKNTLVDLQNENYINGYHNHLRNIPNRVGFGDVNIQFGGDPGGNSKNNFAFKLVKDDGDIVALYTDNVISRSFINRYNDSSMQFYKYYLDFDNQSNSYKEGKILQAAPLNSDYNIKPHGIFPSINTVNSLDAMYIHLSSDNNFFAHVRGDNPGWLQTRSSYIIPTPNSDINTWDLNSAISISSALEVSPEDDVMWEGTESWRTRIFSVQPIKMDDGTWRILCFKRNITNEIVTLSSCAWYMQKRDFIQTLPHELSSVYIDYYPLYATVGYTPGVPTPLNYIYTTSFTILSGVEGGEAEVIFPRDNINGVRLFDPLQSYVMETTASETSGWRFCWDADWSRPNGVNDNPWINYDGFLKSRIWDGDMSPIIYNPMTEDLYLNKPTTNRAFSYVNNITGSTLNRWNVPQYDALHIPFDIILTGGNIVDMDNRIYSYLPPTTIDYNSTTLYGSISGYYRTYGGYFGSKSHTFGLPEQLGHGFYNRVNGDNTAFGSGFYNPSICFDADNKCIYDVINWTSQTQRFTTRKMPEYQISGSGVGTDSFLYYFSQNVFSDTSIHTEYELTDSSGYGKVLLYQMDLYKDKNTGDNYVRFPARSFLETDTALSNYVVLGKLANNQWSTNLYTNDGFVFDDIQISAVDSSSNIRFTERGCNLDNSHSRTCSVMNSVLSTDYEVSHYFGTPGGEIQEGKVVDGVFVLEGVGVTLPSWQSVISNDVPFYIGENKDLTDFKFFGLHLSQGQYFNYPNITHNGAMPLMWSWDKNYTLSSPASNVFYFSVIDAGLYQSTNPDTWYIRNNPTLDYLPVSAFYGIPQIMKCVSSDQGVEFEVLSGFMDTYQPPSFGEYSLTNASTFHVSIDRPSLTIHGYITPISMHNNNVYFTSPAVNMGPPNDGRSYINNANYIIDMNTEVLDINTLSYRISGTSTFYWDYFISNQEIGYPSICRGYHPDFGYYTPAGTDGYAVSQVIHTRPYGIPTVELSGYTSESIESDFFKSHTNFRNIPHPINNTRVDTNAYINKYITRNVSLGSFDLFIPVITDLTLGGKYYPNVASTTITLTPNTTTYLYLEVGNYNANGQSIVSVVKFEGADPGDLNQLGPGARIKLATVETDSDGIIPGSVISSVVDPYNKTVYTSDDIEAIGSPTSTGLYLSLTISGSALYVPLYKM
jgi:hypothetical protein